jgi:hypothetical protein
MAGSRPAMSDAESELVMLDRDIAWVRRRISELEMLASDDRQDVAPGVLRLLLAEWRDRFRSLQDRRDTLLRSISNPDREAGTPNTTTGR